MPDDVRILNAGTADVDPHALTLHPDNPRRGDVPALVESFRSIGFHGLVEVDARTNTVLAGNHRVMAARELGMASIPVVYLATDDDEHGTRILVSDNRLSDIATNDEATLAELLEGLAGSGLHGTGYTDDDLDALLHNQSDPTWLNPDAARLDNVRSRVYVRPVISVEDVELVERAFLATGMVNRAEAFLFICSAFLNEKG